MDYTFWTCKNYSGKRFKISRGGDLFKRRNGFYLLILELHIQHSLSHRYVILFIIINAEIVRELRKFKNKINFKK